MNFSVATDFIRSAAGHLISLVANSERSLAQVEADNPLVASAVQLATAEATAVGIPLVPIEGLAVAVLAVARAVASAAAVAVPAVPTPAVAGAHR